MRWLGDLGNRDWGVAVLVLILIGFVWSLSGACETDCGAIEDPEKSAACFEAEYERRANR